jgi:hypothetical protein
MHTAHATGSAVLGSAQRLLTAWGLVAIGIAGVADADRIRAVSVVPTGVITLAAVLTARREVDTSLGAGAQG